MLNTVYRLVEPRRIESEFSNIDVNGDSVLVRPTHLSICNADQRYFQGTRPPEVLKNGNVEFAYAPSVVEISWVAGECVKIYPLWFGRTAAG